MEELLKTPIVVTISIQAQFGDFAVTKTQLRNLRGKPVQSLSALYKEALADVAPYVRRHDTVVVG